MTEVINYPEIYSETSFKGMKYYLIVAIFFMDIGILFGGLNALRVAEIFQVPEIHNTHWTSTLFGGMTVIMMGLLLYLISLSIDLGPRLQQSGFVVLGILLLGIVSNYIQIWFPTSLLGGYFILLVKVASVIYLGIIAISLLRGKRVYQLRDDASYIMLYAAIVWMAIAQLLLLGYRGVIGPAFRVSYIYGFFSLTLFGSLSFVLPRLFRTKPRSRKIILRDTIFISMSALLLLLNELVNVANTLLGLLGTLFWGLVGFLFILYVFDLIYKRGMSNSLIGLSIALVMFGFFVFDTLMKSVFPSWVNASHAHFMFLGTLIITIVALGIQLMSDNISISQGNDQVYKLILGITILLISAILLGFTLGLFAFAGYSGILLFVSLLMFEGYILKIIRG